MVFGGVLVVSRRRRSRRTGWGGTIVTLPALGVALTAAAGVL